MALLNYTTEVPVQKSAGEIIGLLAGHGARSILSQYNDAGALGGIAFELMTPFGARQYRLPVQVDGVWRRLQDTDNEAARKRARRGPPTHAQAERVAWRIAKDWVEAQLAIVESSMVAMDEVFLAYMLPEGFGGPTVYQTLLERRLQLPQIEGAPAIIALPSPRS